MSARRLLATRADGQYIAGAGAGCQGYVIEADEQSVNSRGGESRPVDLEAIWDV